MGRPLLPQTNCGNGLGYPLVLDDNLSLPEDFFKSKFGVAALVSHKNMGLYGIFNICQAIYHTLVLLFDLKLAILVLIFRYTS